MRRPFLAALLFSLWGCIPPPIATNTVSPPKDAVDPVVLPTPDPSPLPSSVAKIEVPLENGYTVFKQSSDTRMVYVAANGLDTNSGLTPALPVKTIARGVSLLRNGFPDWLLLRRGDLFLRQNLISKNGSWSLSGRSEAEPMLVSSYSDAKAPSSSRPVLATQDLSAWNSYGANHLAIVGINFHANTRDPYSSDYAYPSGVTIAQTGFSLGGNNSDILIEDCVIDSYGNNVSFDAQGAVLNKDSNIRLRRNLIKNAFSNNRSQGVYMGAIDGILIEGNIFNHNGWTEMTSKTKTWNFMPQNHNLYLRGDNQNVIVRGNLFANGADFGAEIRPGGLIHDNLFIRNNAGLSFGLTNGAAGTKGGVTGEVRGNVILDGRTDADVGAFCIELGNVKKASVHDNICAREMNDTKLYGQAFVLDVGNGVTNPQDEVGINDLTVENNLVYSWATGIYVNSQFLPGGAQQRAMNGLIVRNNEFQMITKRVVDWQSSVQVPYVSISGNKYFGIFPVKDTQFLGPTVQNVGFTKWTTLSEPTADYLQIPYPDAASATVEAYFKGTFEQFMADEELQSKYTFKSSRSVYFILPFLRAKFGK